MAKCKIEHWITTDVNGRKKRIKVRNVKRVTFMGQDNPVIRLLMSDGTELDVLTVHEDEGVPNGKVG